MLLTTSIIIKCINLYLVSNLTTEQIAKEINAPELIVIQILIKKNLYKVSDAEQINTILSNIKDKYFDIFNDCNSEKSCIKYSEYIKSIDVAIMMIDTYILGLESD